MFSLIADSIENKKRKMKKNFEKKVEEYIKAYIKRKINEYIEERKRRVKNMLSKLNPVNIFKSIKFKLKKKRR